MGVVRPLIISLHCRNNLITGIANLPLKIGGNLCHNYILMKKLVLLLTTCIGFGTITKAQLNSLALTDTVYVQNFNALGSGLPIGWHVFTEATASSLGVYWDTSSTKLLTVPSATGSTRTNWNSTTGNFRNVASANNSATPSLDSIAQLAATDRALAVRQIGASATNPFGAADSSTAFALKITNTLHKADFKLSFKLQSLDTSSPRVSTWLVDYGIGATPTSFIPVTTTGTMTTGGNTYSNNTITVDFPAALDSLNDVVWIRVATLTKTTGASNRTTTAIDDFHLSYYNSQPVSVANVNNTNMPLSVLGNATSNRFTLGFTATDAGKYSLEIYDLAGRMLHNESINALTGVQRYTVTGMNLASGMYIVKLSNGTQTGLTKVTVQ